MSVPPLPAALVEQVLLMTFITVFRALNATVAFTRVVVLTLVRIHMRLLEFPPSVPTSLASRFFVLLVRFFFFLYIFALMLS